MEAQEQRLGTWDEQAAVPYKTPPDKTSAPRDLHGCGCASITQQPQRVTFHLCFTSRETPTSTGVLLAQTTTTTRL